MIAQSLERLILTGRVGVKFMEEVSFELHLRDERDFRSRDGQ